MEYVVYSFDPRGAEFIDFKGDTRSRHLPPERRAASWQREDGDDEHVQQVADIMAATRPLRARL